MLIIVCACCCCGGGGGGDSCCGDFVYRDTCVDTKEKIQLHSGKIKCEDLKTDIPLNRCYEIVTNDPCGKLVRDYCPESCHCSGAVPVNIFCTKQCTFDAFC
mmetsp:Transcript_40747/g.45929  ORF Transcript_40747/g.45929 Transcript_40747/m.45929 type:complete len:102 (+) Transcript_40747:1719-2024(+)